jgi:tetratricopeptide (TPR) repeat protein
MPSTSEKPLSAVDDAARLERLLELSDASRVAGRHTAGAQQAEEATALAERLGATSSRARALSLLATHELRLGQNEECVATALEAIALTEELGDQTALSSALNIAAMAYHELGLAEEALELAARSLDAANRCGDPVTLAWAHNRAGIVNDVIGPGGRVRSLTLALSLAREAGDAEAIFSALNNLVEEHADLVRAERERGNEGAAAQALAAALAYGEEALELGRAAGNAHREAISLLNLADAVGLAGDDERALRLLLSSTVISRREGYRPLMPSAHKAIAAIKLRRGDVDEAIEIYGTALLEAEAAGDVAVRLDLELALSGAYRERGEFEEALAHFERHHALERQHHERIAGARVRVLTNQLELERARLEAARR